MSNHRASLSPDLRTGGVHSSNLGQIPNTPMTAAIEDQSPYDLSSNNGVDTQTSDQFSTDPYSFDPEAPMATSEDADDLANIQQQHAQAMLLQSQMLAQAQQRALLVGQAYGNDDVSPDAYAIQLESDLLQFQVFFFNVHKCVNFAKWLIFDYRRCNSNTNSNSNYKFRRRCLLRLSCSRWCNSSNSFRPRYATYFHHDDDEDDDDVPPRGRVTQLSWQGMGLSGG